MTINRTAWNEKVVNTVFVIPKQSEQKQKLLSKKK